MMHQRRGWKRGLRVAELVAPAIVLALASTGPAAASQLGREAAPPAITQGDLQIRLNAARRDLYQSQQQILRQLDRDANTRPAERPDVPVVGGSCRMEAVGTRIVRICR